MNIRVKRSIGYCFTFHTVILKIFIVSLYNFYFVIYFYPFRVNDTALLDESQDFTILIKNFVDFPKFTNSSRYEYSCFYYVFVLNYYV